MGIASLVLGIISIVTGWIPFVCFLAFILAIIGLILGIVDTIKKNKIGDKNRGISIAGLIVSAIAIPIIIFSSIVSFGIFAAIMYEDWDTTNYNSYTNENYDYDYDYDWYNSITNGFNHNSLNYNVI